MKKLLSLILILSSFYGVSQTPLPTPPQNLGSKNTAVQTWHLFSDTTLRIPIFFDTAAANNSRAKLYRAAIIFCSQDNSFWIRNNTATQWVSVGSGGGSGICNYINGGVVTWNSLLTFDVSAATYCINNTLYSSLSDTITLDAADPTFNRLDVIGLDTTGNVFKITGTPSSSPEVPQVNPLSQLYRTSVLVPAGATVPNGVTSVTLWDENTGSPEYTGTSSGITTNFNNTINPYHLTKATDIGAFTDGGVRSLISYDGGTAYSVTTYNSIKFFVRLKSAFDTDAGISVTLKSGGVSVTTAYVIGATEGFSKSTVGSYQNITIPFSSFTFVSDPLTIDGVRFEMIGTNADGIYLDYITLTGGVTTGTTNYLTDVYASNDSLYKVKNGVPEFWYKVTGGGTTDSPTIVKSPCYVIPAGTDGSIYDSLVCPIDSIANALISDSVRKYIPFSGTGDSTIYGDLEFKNVGDYKKMYSKNTDGEIAFNLNNEENIAEVNSVNTTNGTTAQVSVKTPTGAESVNFAISDGVNPTSTMQFSQAGLNVDLPISTVGIRSQYYYAGKDSTTYSQMADIADSMARARAYADSVAGAGGGLSPIPNRRYLGNVSGSSALPDTLQYSIFNVKDFGLVDDSSTDNTTALRTLVAQLPDGASVYFPGGGLGYKVSDSIVIDKNLNIYGDGNSNYLFWINDYIPHRGASNIFLSAGDKKLFIIKSSATNISPVVNIHDLTLKNTSTPTTSKGIYIGANVAMTHIYNTTVYGFGDNIHCNGSNRVVIEKSQIIAPLKDAIILENALDFDGGSNRIFDNNIFSASTATTVSRGVYIKGGGNIDISRNMFNAQLPLTVNTQFVYQIYSDFKDGPTSEIKIHDNFFDNYQTNGIRLRDSSAPTTYSSVSNIEINDNNFAPLYGVATSLAAIDIKGFEDLLISDNVAINGAPGQPVVKLDSCTNVRLGLITKTGFGSNHTATNSTNIKGVGEWDYSGNDIYRSSGNVGIGAAPGAIYSLDVTSGIVQLRLKSTLTTNTAATVVENSTGYSGQFFKAGSSYGTYKNLSNHDLGFYNGTNAGNISILNDYASGGFGVATGGSSTNRLFLSSSGALQLSAYGAGTLVTDASGNITASSDERLKTKIKPASAGLKEILKLKPITYSWNDLSGNETAGTYSGFSAQNVIASGIANATGIDSNGYLTLQDRAILAASIKAIQELSAEVEKLKAEIKQMR